MLISLENPTKFHVIQRRNNCSDREKNSVFCSAKFRFPVAYFSSAEFKIVWIVYTLILYYWTVNRWIMYCEIAQPIFLNWHDKMQNNQNLTIISMVKKYFVNHTLFCKNKLCNKPDAHVVPENKNKVRTIRRSDQLIRNKNKIFHCLNVITYSCKTKL